MIGQRHARRVVTTTAFVLALVVAGSASAHAAEPLQARDIPAAQRALADEFGGTPGEYALEAERSVSVDGHDVWAAKFSDVRTGEIRLVYRDETGRIGGPEVLEAARTQALAELSPLERKASPELLEVAATARTGSALPVAVWLDVDTKHAVDRVRRVLGEDPC